MKPHLYYADGSWHCVQYREQPFGLFGSGPTPETAYQDLLYDLMVRYRYD